MEPIKKPRQEGKKGTKGNKIARMELRLTPADKVLIETKAKEAGHKPTEYLRRAGLGLEVKQRLTTELKQVLFATSKNLNQCLKLAHMGRLDGVDADTLSSIIQALAQATR